MKMQDILAKAIETEELGHRFYLQQAGESANVLAKRLFAELASDEKRHAEWFRELLSQVDSPSTEYPGVDAGSDIEHRIKAVFKDISATAGANKSAGQEDVLKMAIVLEKESYGVYNDLWKKAASTDEKAFYDRLRREEYGHLAALENVLQYLTKTGMWFDVEESKRWNWMNI